jgi:hypothetical protein
MKRSRSNQQIPAPLDKQGLHDLMISSFPPETYAALSNMDRNSPTFMFSIRLLNQKVTPVLGLRSDTQCPTCLLWGHDQRYTKCPVELVRKALDRKSPTVDMEVFRQIILSRNFWAALPAEYAPLFNNSMAAINSVVNEVAALLNPAQPVEQQVVVPKNQFKHAADSSREILMQFPQHPAPQERMSQKSQPQIQPRATLSQGFASRQQPPHGTSGQHNQDASLNQDFAFPQIQPQQASSFVAQTTNPHQQQKNNVNGEPGGVYLNDDQGGVYLNDDQGSFADFSEGGFDMLNLRSSSETDLGRQSRPIHAQYGQAQKSEVHNGQEQYGYAQGRNMQAPVGERLSGPPHVRNKGQNGIYGKVENSQAQFRQALSHQHQSEAQISQPPDQAHYSQTQNNDGAQNHGHAQSIPQGPMRAQGYIPNIPHGHVPNTHDGPMQAASPAKQQDSAAQLGKLNLETIPFGLLQEVSAGGYTIAHGNDMLFDHRKASAPLLVRVLPFLVHSSG